MYIATVFHSLRVISVLVQNSIFSCHWPAKIVLLCVHVDVAVNCKNGPLLACCNFSDLMSYCSCFPYINFVVCASKAVVHLVCVTESLGSPTSAQ